jgi:c-di-GMP-binding flagellar brake protein YcgR
VELLRVPPIAFMMELGTKTMGIGCENFSTPERRTTDRFPIENDVRYKLLEARRVAQTGQGRTLNMSSGGILFTSESRLPVGLRVELAVDWPAQLNEHCGLKLVALGKIVRSSTETAAIRIEKYDFRTRAAAAASA